MNTRQWYVNKAEEYRQGIDALKDIIRTAETAEEMRELALRYSSDIAILEQQYRIHRGAYDLLYFAYEYFSDERNPENENNLFPKEASMAKAPEVHRELCEMLEDIAWDNHNGKVCYSMPRGFAKSTFVSNVFPIHQCYYECSTDGGRKYILVISETEDLACKFLEWVNGQLKYNKKLRDDLGIIMNESKFDNEKDTGGEFITLRGTMLRAAGMGKALRGARNGSYRPDLVILDDLESMANTNTPELRQKNLYWYNSVVEPIGTKERTAFLYVGTLVHGQGLLPDILTRIDYNSRKYSAIVSEPVHAELWETYCNILDDKTDLEREHKADKFYAEHKELMDKGCETLWEDRWSYADLMKKRSILGSKAFNSEYLNIAYDPDSQIFSDNNVSYYDDKDLFDAQGRKLAMDIFGFWDLAVGKGNKRDDFNAIVIIGRAKLTGVMYVLDAWSGKVPAHKALEVAESKIAQWSPKLFGIETIQMQYEFYRQLQKRVMEKGLYNTRIKDYNPKAKKEDRIEILEPLFETGYLRIKKSQRLLIDQLYGFPNYDHDDLPDALASAVDLAGKTSRRKSFYQKPSGW